jgi:hypothetical protein
VLGVLWVLIFEKNGDCNLDSLASEWQSLTIKKTGLRAVFKEGH